MKFAHNALIFIGNHFSPSLCMQKESIALYNQYGITISTINIAINSLAGNISFKTAEVVESNCFSVTKYNTHNNILIIILMDETFLSWKVFIVSLLLLRYFFCWLVNTLSLLFFDALTHIYNLTAKSLLYYVTSILPHIKKFDNIFLDYFIDLCYTIKNCHRVENAWSICFAQR